MITSQYKRVAALEAQSGPGDCSCEGNERIVWTNYREAWGKRAPEPGPVMCPVCGGMRVTFTVEYTDNWRGSHDTVA